ncbi:hypothetical protein HYU95_04475 [Candidatus Daviesbacteria bacterium]|nr:hypothetical protein [Candidatus Daviesbacteria bacterium]
MSEQNFGIEPQEGSIVKEKEPTVRLYRGTNLNDITQEMAGGLRSGKFTLEELLTLPVSELAKRSGNPDLEGIARFWEDLEKMFTHDEVKAYAFTMNAMEVSPWISASISPILAASFSEDEGKILVLDVPQAQVVNISKLTERIYKYLNVDVGDEGEFGIIGKIQQEWIKGIEKSDWIKEQNKSPNSPITILDNITTGNKLNLTSK